MPRDPSEMPADRVVEVYSAANSIEAHCLCTVLTDAGIQAQVVGEQLGNAAGGLPLGESTAPRIWVREADATRAREIIEDRISQPHHEWGEPLDGDDRDELEEEPDEEDQTTYGDVSWERMERAVEKVRQRLLRASAALEQAGVPYAVVGGNAVAAWVSRVDEAAVRNTQDVDILIRRNDLSAAIEAMSKAGFVYRHAAGIDMLLDGPEAKARDAVHLVFAGEKVRPEYLLATPNVEESEPGTTFRLLLLESLVRMKLTSFRRKDQMHLLDLIEVGLIDAKWRERFPSELGDRLQELIDHPEG